MLLGRSLPTAPSLPEVHLDDGEHRTARIAQDGETSWGDVHGARRFRTSERAMRSLGRGEVG